jgi:hypothetical protein
MNCARNHHLSGSALAANQGDAEIRRDPLNLRPQMERRYAVTQQNRPRGFGRRWSIARAAGGFGPVPDDGLLDKMTRWHASDFIGTQADQMSRRWSGR